VKLFRPHRYTFDAFTDGSALWLSEWRDERTYREHFWTPEKGYRLYKDPSGSVWVKSTSAFPYHGGVEVTPSLAANLIKAWKLDNRWR
jgi:hypothetical protein